MIPNENYRKYFPAEELPGERPSAVRSSCLRIGAFLVIRKLLTVSGVSDALAQVLPPDDLGLFQDLMAYSIVTEGNAAQHYPCYAYSHPLFTAGMRISSDSRVSSFLQSLGPDQSSGFLDSWNRGRNRQGRVFVSYDSTNKNSQAGDLEMVEYGKPKEDRGLPVFNYSLVHDLGRREPLFYEEYPGSVVDVSQLQFMIGKARGYGYGDVCFILDRGYFSKENIGFLDATGFGFVLMVRGMAKLVSQLVLSVRGTFECRRASEIRRYRTYGVTVRSKLYADDSCERFFHIYYSSGRDHAEREAVESRLERMGRYLKRNEGCDIAVSDSLRHYYDLILDGSRLLCAKERTEVIDRELELCGYFCIVTSEEMTATEALTLYKGRDESEKLFRGDKSYLGDRSMRVSGDESTAAKIFIEFAALIIRHRIYTSLKAAVLKNARKANFMTVPAAIRELEKIEMVRLADGIYRLDHAVTATQKEILSAFGLDADFVKTSAAELSETLRNLK